MQRINRAKKQKGWRPKGEREALDCLYYCRKLHLQQQARGGRSHHEQSVNSRGPFGSEDWPWAISKNYRETSSKVAG